MIAHAEIKGSCDACRPWRLRIEKTEDVSKAFKMDHEIIVGEENEIRLAQNSRVLRNMTKGGVDFAARAPCTPFDFRAVHEGNRNAVAEMRILRFVAMIAQVLPSVRGITPEEHDLTAGWPEDPH